MPGIVQHTLCVLTHCPITVGDSVSNLAKSIYLVSGRLIQDSKADKFVPEPLPFCFLYRQRL